MLKTQRTMRVVTGPLTVAALWAATAATPAVAANGDIPVFQATAIAQPGRYVVTRDIAAPGNVVVVQTGGVTIDLNGHTLTSSGGSGVVLDLTGPPPYADIRIENGQISGGETGIKGVSLPAVLPVVVEKVGIVMPMFSCIDLPDGRLEVRESVLRNCGKDGIRMSANGAGLIEVEDTLIADIVENGIYAASADGVTVRASTIRRFATGIQSFEYGGVRFSGEGKVGLTVLDSVISDGGPRGVGVLMELAGGAGFPSPASVVGNQIFGNAQGIVVRQGPARITNNTIAGNLSHGLRVEAAGIVTPSMISGNSLLGNGGNGIFLADGSARINGNTIGGNVADGVLIGGLRALLESNFLEGNGGAGLRFLNGTGHAYRSNFLRGNTGGGVLDPFNNTDAGGNIP